MPETIQEAFDFMRSVNMYIIFKVDIFDREAESITHNCCMRLVDEGAIPGKIRHSWAVL